MRFRLPRLHFPRVLSARRRSLAAPFGPRLWIAGPQCPPGAAAVETIRGNPRYQWVRFVAVPHLPATAAGIRLNLTGYDGPMVYILPDREDPEITGLILECARRGHVVVACETRPGQADRLRARAKAAGIRTDPFLLANAQAPSAGRSPS